MNIIKSIFKQILSAFFPFRCHACKSNCEFGVVLCKNCQKKLTDVIHAPEPVNDINSDITVYTMSSYDSFAADMVKIIKYRPSKKLAGILGNICAEKADLKNFFSENDVIIPVPMHEKRLKERGFNQASVLAETYAKQTNTNFCPAIIRSRFTKPQASCSEKERLTNLENAFILNPDLDKSAFKNKRLIVIDDVATTGTTLLKSISPLKELETKEIIALVVAHSYKKQNNK